MVSKWVYRISDNVFLYGGFYDPPFDPVTQGVVAFLDADVPNIVTERYDVTSLTKRRLATQLELDTVRLALADASADAAATQQELYTMCATVLEKFDVTWAGLTNAAKKQAVRDLAARWAFWRKQATRANV